MSQELVPHGITSVALSPGFMRTERVLAALSREDADSDDSAMANNGGDADGGAASLFDSPHWAQEPRLRGTESPEYLGRAVTALARDKFVIRKTGQTMLVADLACEYGFYDVDGTKPGAFKVPSVASAARAAAPAEPAAPDASVSGKEGIAMLIEALGGQPAPEGYLDHLGGGALIAALGGQPAGGSHSTAQDTAAAANGAAAAAAPAAKVAHPVGQCPMAHIHGNKGDNPHEAGAGAATGGAKVDTRAWDDPSHAQDWVAMSEGDEHPCKACRQQ